jgi:hypothetical protein
MNLEQVKREIKQLERSPVAEKMYPITSSWVPVTDVLAILARFEKYWIEYRDKKENFAKAELIVEILGES